MNEKPTSMCAICGAPYLTCWHPDYNNLTKEQIMQKIQEIEAAKRVLVKDKI